MSDRKKMQADGGGRKNGPAPKTRPDGPAQHGESGGGPYPNPHEGKEGGHFGGGQSDKAYHGHGQLGERSTGDNANAPTRKS